MARGATKRHPAAVQSTAKPVRATRARRSRWGLRTVVVLAAIALGIAVPFYVLAGRGQPGASSTANSASWALQTSDFHALAFSPNDSNTIFFGHHNGLMRTIDGGQSWTPLVDRPNFDA